MEIVLIAVAVVIAIVAIWLWRKDDNPKPNKPVRRLVTPKARVNIDRSNPPKYTRKEVERHNTKDDCWLIIKNKVYDVTTYIPSHPGGDRILNNAGRDSTEGFSGDQHPDNVWTIIEDFYIGDLVDEKTD